ncbi:hypothetical protein DVT68_00150 [Dyella solisilvae]|uniref:Uncharacterized protein n=1 Tax=Dyella solisilvae TaxID=1920168 RepID=A0A370K9J1_9GAMM|nr:hypothetical protein [Dyella solisilvae]RDI99314.1 hypothetical protein DVT68_00150 [Dyella solisilvae]
MNDLYPMDGARSASVSVQQRPQQQRSDFADVVSRDSDASPQVKSGQASGHEGASGDVMATGPNMQADVSARTPVVSTQTLEASVTAQLLQRETVVQPVGDIEATRDARIFGVHLLAGRYLSELALVDPAGAASQASDSLGMAREVPSTHDGAGRGMVMPMSAEESSPAESLSDALVAPMEIVWASSTAESEQASPHAAALIGSAAEWLKRLLRYGREPDGSTVAWVRDFRLPDAQSGAVVAAVLRDAARQGVTLQRIVLNGRTAWSSSQNQTGEST